MFITHQDKKTSWNKRISATVIALTALLLPACATNEPQVTAPDTTTQTPGVSTPVAEQDKDNVTAPEVSQNTQELIGKLVTVRSQDINRVNDNVFTITDREAFGGERIAVVNNTGKPVDLPVPQDTRLQVTGTVANFDPNTIKQEYGVDLGQDAFQEYVGKPAIIARSIALAPTPGVINENPQTYYNKVISVPGNVSRIYGPNAFVVEDRQVLGTNPLLVLVTNQLKDKAPIKEGEKVVTTGTLRPFVVTEIEKEYSPVWDANLRGQLEKEYSQRPVLIAEGIYPSALPQNAR
ncbi:hypothetical protein [Anabaena sp. UHCC 0399]|uniref:hypothetical protein n=1 Tax=Anabaena sp. UHCC 0399 TaxID=3110238 RepID=UPI002B205B20|nr:hypothetical protein [Anabaena sp. UHCC 0399]MEA5565724.1 hypothetical protein [Anabaena sp. UHCC 0399]